VIKELLGHIPENVRNSEAVRELAGCGCLTRMHVVRLLAPRLANEDQTKDVDFKPPPQLPDLRRAPVEPSRAGARDHVGGHASPLGARTLPRTTKSYSQSDAIAAELAGAVGDVVTAGQAGLPLFSEHSKNEQRPTPKCMSSLAAIGSTSSRNHTVHIS
jgi:Patatin phospholipase